MTVGGAAITGRGAGEKAPLKVDDPSRYSKDEPHRPLRRVEMTRPDNTPGFGLEL